MKTKQKTSTHNKSAFPLAQIDASNESFIVMYTAEDNSIRLDVKLEGETVWLSQQQMVLLFGRDKSVISRHIKNIFEEGELDKSLKGYAVNQNISLQHYDELKNVVKLMSRTYQLQESVSKDEAEGLLTMIGDYVYALDTLDHYDYQRLPVEKTTTDAPFHATYENAMEAINLLKPKFGGVVVNLINQNNQ